MKELLERVEKAEGPDRDLDYDISIAFQSYGADPTHGHYLRRKWFGPNLTASIDAALALVEKVKPGCQKSLIESPTVQTTRGYPFSCDLYDTTGPDGQHYGRFQGVGWEAEGAGNSFPLAILSALLRSTLSEHPE